MANAFEKETGGEMTIKELWDRKTELGYTYEQLEEKTGIPKKVIEAIFDENWELVHSILLWELEFVLDSETVVKEAVATLKGKEKAEYTKEDFYNLGEDAHFELIDGILYDLATPTSIHQLLCTKIATELSKYIDSQSGECLVFGVSPNIEIDHDIEKHDKKMDKTVVIPDVVVLCDREKLKDGKIIGAPEFVVEVLSPSTAKYDKGIKFKKYMNAGVKEYWIIDPKRKSVCVYIFSNYSEFNITVYSFTNEVPVFIFNNECKVDFRKIYESIAFLYENET